MIKKLMSSQKFDLKKKNNLGNNLLHISCYNPNIEVLKYLLDLNLFDPFKKNMSKMDLFHLATKYNSLEMLECLIEHLLQDGKDKEKNLKKRKKMGTICFIWPQKKIM